MSNPRWRVSLRWALGQVAILAALMAAWAAHADEVARTRCGTTAAVPVLLLLMIAEAVVLTRAARHQSIRG